MQGVGVFLLFLTLSGASALVSDWGLDEGLIMEMQEKFGDPLKRALQGLSVLMDYRGPAIDTSSPWVKETSNNTQELSREKDEALRYYLPSANSDISEQCRHDVQEIHKAFTVTLAGKPKLWSSIMVDSWGKLPDGYILGNTVLVGMMEECTAINVDDQDDVDLGLIPVKFNATFKGQYCFIAHGPEIPWILQAEANPGSPAISGNIYNFLFSGSTYGTCMPDSCSREDFKVSLEEILPTGNAAHVVDCHTLDEELQWEPQDIAFMCVMGFIAFLVVAAAAVDLTINYMDAQELRKGPLRYLLVFSGYTNMSKIFYINTKASQANIACLHGIRVLSMTWVIYGHQNNYVQSVSENPLNMFYMYDSLLAQTILGATPSVDSFFFLSGLLVAYSLMRSKDKMDLFGFFMFYAHRILRLMPPIAAVCFFTATVARFFSTGPLGGVYNTITFEPCNQNWIWDVLFINNFTEKMCLGQTWYTSVDMQIYFLVPIIFFPLMYYGMIGKIWLAVMTLVSFIIPTILSHVYHLALGMFGPPEQGRDNFFYLYCGPWSRMSPYLIGMWTGYIIYKSANKKVTMNNWQVLLGWVLAWVIGLLCVYGAWPYNDITLPNFGPEKIPTQTVSDVYNGFMRGAWGLALMWVVLACHYGYGGPINSFLGHPSWQPLSRLTYGMFLVHITIQNLVSGSQYTLLHFDHLTVIIQTCGTLFLAGIGACILSLLVDSPVMGLEKLLLFKEKDKKDNLNGVNVKDEKKNDDILTVETPAEKK